MAVVVLVVIGHHHHRHNHQKIGERKKNLEKIFFLQKSKFILKYNTKMMMMMIEREILFMDLHKNSVRVMIEDSKIERSIGEKRILKSIQKKI